MSDQPVPMPAGGDPATLDIELTPPGDNTALAITDAPAPAGTPLDNVDTLIWHIDRTTTLASILAEYITRNFKSDIDFGVIKGETSDGRNFDSKPELLKPGAEKLIAVLGLRVRFVPDKATLAMAGNPPGLFALKCLLINWRGEIVGEGRGAASLTERKSWKVNNAIKICEKRAQADAICRVACVSAHFTQDADAVEGERHDTHAARQEQRQEQRPAPTAPTAAQGAQAGEPPVNHKSYVWHWYKRNRQEQNQSIDNESVIGDINDLLRTLRLGCNVNTATAAEWARAYNEIRKTPARAQPPANHTYEEIFN
jgi:hypothetical protein